MESKLFLDINNSNKENEELLLLNSRLNNKTYNNKKRILPKLNYSSLSDSFDTFPEILKNDKNKKHTLNYKDYSNNQSTDFTKEIRQAKEFKDLEKIYEKWLNRGKNETNKKRELYIKGNYINLRKKNFMTNNLFLKSRKTNLKLDYKNIQFEKSKYNKTQDENINRINNNFKPNRNKNIIKIKLFKTKKEVNLRKEIEDTIIDNEEKEKIKKEMEHKIKKNIKETIKKEMEEKEKKNNAIQTRKSTNEIIRKETEEKMRKEKEEKLRKEKEERMRKDVQEKIKKETEEKIKKETEEKIKKEMEEKIKKEIEKKLKKETEKKIKKEEEEKIKKEREEKLREEIKMKELEEMSEKKEKEKKYLIFKEKKGLELKETIGKELEEKKEEEEEEKIEKIRKNLIKKEDYKNYFKYDNNYESINNKLILSKEKNQKIFTKEISEIKDESSIDKFKIKNGHKIRGKFLENNENSKLINNLINKRQDKSNNKNINKRKSKIIKSIELNDIIKNANLFLLEKNNSNINLLKKLEYINSINKIIENEIKENKNSNLITPDEAIYYIDNNIIRFLGYFGSELIYRNITTFIEKSSTNKILRDISFKILTSGLATQKVYKLIIKNEVIRNKIKEDEKLFYEYFEEIKSKISDEFQINEDDIYFFTPNIYNYEQNLLIYNSNNIEGLESFLKSEKFIFSKKLLLNNIILSPCIFEENFCKSENSWSKKKLKRGGKDYFPPFGWSGISLKVSQKFNKNYLLWLGKKNLKGEWPVAYHAIGNGNIFNRLLDIFDGNLKNEEIKLYKDVKNIENNKNKFPFCEEGLYCSPIIQDVENLADKTSFGVYNTKFRFALMARINPDKIRNPGGKSTCWILSGNYDEIRPYRLLFKICTN